MRGTSILPLLVVALVPLTLFGLIIVGSSLGAVGWRPPVLWSESFGSPIGASGITAVTVYNANRYVCGYLNSTTTFGTPFIREYDLNGGDVWTTTLASGPSTVTSPLLLGISVNTAGLFVIGDINDNITLLKYDFTGNQLWVRQLGRTYGGEAAFATSTGVFVAGVASGLFPNETYSVQTPFIRQYDANGNTIWTQKLANSPTGVYALYVDSSGVFVLSDNFLLKYDLSGNELWAIGAAGKGLSVDATGSYVSGSSLTKYRIDGTMAWSTVLHTPDGNIVADSLVSSDSSGVYVSMSDGKGRQYVTKYDSSDNQIWTSRVDPVPSNLLTYRGGYIITVASGGVYLAGSTEVGQLTYAVVEELAESSSLVFFGVNPPWSFVTVGVLSAAVVFSSFFWFRKYQRRLNARPRSVTRYHPNFDVTR